MFLCHKCKGVLAAMGDDDTGLYGCGCISGYYRGFEPNLNRQEAIEAQIKEQDELMKLYLGQKRGPSFTDGVRARKGRLEALLVS